MSSPSFPPSTPGGATPASAPAQGLAVASLVLGILSVLGLGFVLVVPILAVVFGHIALSRSSKEPQIYGGRGLAIAGLVTGYLGFVLFFFGLLAALAIPAFQKVREAALEKVLINDGRMIGSAAQQVMMENGGKPVTFSIDPTTGAVSGPIGQLIPTIKTGTLAVDGRLENDQDGFSLKNPNLRKGRVYYFNSEGRLKP